MNPFKSITILALLILAIPSVSIAETIKGYTCYRYSDRESISVARDIALAMAKRDALEGYAVFVESTSTVRNATMINDIITGLAIGFNKVTS